MKLYNSLTKQKEEFIPINGNDVKIYGCGITVSADAHIGHALQALVFDVLRKYLQFIGYKVTYVRNYTDVDDKIIANAQKNGLSAKEYAEKYLARIMSDLKNFNIDSADIECKASEHIPQIIDFVSKLIEKGYAYESNGDVFFIVDKFKEYGKLSNRNSNDMLSGVRKELIGEKENDRDFALWKSAKVGEISWDSPWGKGRPGWHIECSAMIRDHLGSTIDIHGGGRDLIFPHHENEIAQSEALNCAPLANYWVHCGLVKVNGVKMSKSLFNSITLGDALTEYDDETLKLAMLESNYKSDLNITDNLFLDAEKHMYKFYKTLSEIKGKYSDENSDFAQKIIKEFTEAMNDDLNTAKATANLYNYDSEINSKIKNGENLAGVYETIIRCYNVLDIFKKEPVEFIEKIKNKYLLKNRITKKEIANLLSERQNFKAIKAYDKADEIKNYLLSKNISLKDNATQTQWEIDFK